jgi:tetratricopeptide (TPR) repeat protein
MNAGINLWIGNNPAMNDAVALRPGAAWEALADEPARAGQARTPREYDAYFLGKVRSFCATSPGRCALNLAEKARQLLHGKEIPRNESLALARRRSPVLAALTWTAGPFAFPWGLLGPLALVGLVRGCLLQEPGERRGSGRIRVLAAALLLLAAGPVLFFVTGRYRVPMVPVAAVFAGAGAAALRRSPRSRALAAALGIGLVASAWPMDLPAERVNYEAEEHYLAAGALAGRGDTAGAEEALKQALRLRPDYLEAAVNLAVLCAEQGRLAEAARWLAVAQKVAPEDPVVRQLAAVLEGKERGN